VFLSTIKIYWLIPIKYRKKCLFKESCSHFVYRQTKEQGYKKGFNAFFQRYKQCRSHYSIIELEGKQFVLLNDHTLIEREKMII